MAVYERTYRLWSGPSTAAWRRFTIVPRYAFREIFRSRWLLAYFVLCFVSPLGSAGVVWVANSDIVQAMPEIDVTSILSINEQFFMGVFRGQFWASFFLAVFIGPGLISRDLANNGLPLILSRPFSRTEYVIGKMAVLCTLVASVAWLAPLLILALHINFKGLAWAGEHWQLVFGMLVAPWLWVLTVSIFALAMSAWVRWKAVAGFGMMFLVLAGSLFGLMIASLFHTKYGFMVNLWLVIDRLVASLLGAHPLTQLPTVGAWISLIAFLALCLFLLERKLRAYQVVR